jgi:hypothetical protein
MLEAEDVFDFDWEFDCMLVVIEKFQEQSEGVIHLINPIHIARVTQAIKVRVALLGALRCSSSRATDSKSLNHSQIRPSEWHMLDPLAMEPVRVGVLKHR